MPPKNREKDTDSSKLIADQKMAEREQLFLQAFEKPTQIYRYLRCRNAANPFMLHRTLSYMKSRSSRDNKGRKGFKVDSLLETILSKLRIERVNIYGNYLNIVYLGLYDKAKELNWEVGDVVKVTAVLYQTSHSKRKEIGSDIEQIWLGGANVTVNSDDTSQCPVVSIPFQSFQPYGEFLHKNYKIIFEVKVIPIEDKKDDIINVKANTKLYGSELNLLDKNNRCICEGEYEVALHDISSINLNKIFSPKKSSWITLPDDSECAAITEQITIFEKCPTLKFQLKWSNKVSSIVVNSSIKYESERVTSIVTSSSDHIETINNNSFDSSYRNLNIKREKMKEEKPLDISYKFVYNNNTRQETDLVHNVSCPWCGINCIKLYTLLKHLKLCHSRFNFTYQPLTNGAQIIVTINDLYDGSYTGSPHDLMGATGCSFARTRGPVRRTPVTNLLVCRPRRQKNYSLTEFLESDEDELNNQRPYITGHNRLYYHTETYLPVHSNEIYVDSEDERDPHWLQLKTIQMIDEFTDVNEGEKELIKIWNLHMMKHGFVGDCQIPIACDMLVEEKGTEILRKNLYRNFVIHIVSLYNYGLLSSEFVYKIVLKLQKILSTYPLGLKVLANTLEIQSIYWNTVGQYEQKKHDLNSQFKLHEIRCTEMSSKASSSANDLMKPPLSTKSLKSLNASNTANTLGSSSASTSYIKKGNTSKTIIKSKGDGNNSSKQSSSSSLNTNQLKRKVTRNQSTANEDLVQSSSSSSSRRRSLPLSILPKDLKPRRQSVANIDNLPKSSNQTHVLRKRNLVTKVENIKK